MVRKLLLGSACGVLLGLGSICSAEVIVRVRPPAAIVERRVVAPGRGFVWVPGYHAWNGTAYVWTPGSWVRPPRPGARWVPHRWVHRRGGWVLVEGRWR